MLKIQKIRSYSSYVVATIFAAAIITSGAIAMNLFRANAAGPVTINVTTTVDEDVNPGTGCSIYEATVAANTGAAYGGCTAGSLVDGSIISIPAGTYALDLSSDDTDVKHTMILDNVSLQGAGSDQTFLQGYWFELSGDTDAELSGVHLSNVQGDTINNPSIFLNINGSNKTLSDVMTSSYSPGMAPASIQLANNGSTVSNVTIDQVTQEQASSSTITCNGTCSDILIRDYNATAVYDSAIQLSGIEGVTVEDSVVSSETGTTVRVGENATLTNLAVNSTGIGYASIEVEAGTVANGLSQTSVDPSGSLTITGEAASMQNIEQTALFTGTLAANITYNVDTPILRNYTANGRYVSLTNLYPASEVSGVDINASANNVYFTTWAADLHNISYTGDAESTIYFTNTQDGAVVSDISFISQKNTDNGVIGSFSGNDNTYDSVVMESGAPQNSAFAFSGSNPTFTDIDLHNVTMSVTLSAPGTFLMDGISLDGGGPFGIQVAGAPFTTGVITNVSMKNTQMGFNIQGGDSGDLVVSNVSVSDVGSSSAPAALYIGGVDHVNIDTLLLERVAASTPGSIFITGGTSHTIKNSTIFNSNGGLMLVSTSDPVEMSANNVTVVNNLEGVDYAANNAQTAIFASGGSTITYNISNSIFAGTSNYVRCLDGSGSAVFNIDHSLASDQTCIDIGFEEINDVAGLTLQTNAVNGSTKAAIGSNGQDGPVKTLALPAGSQALTFGDAATCETTDARGFVRDDAAGCDAGSYQRTVAVIPEDPEEETGSGSGSGSGSGTGTGTPGGKKTSQSSGSGATNSDTDEDVTQSNTDTDTETVVPISAEDTSGENENVTDNNDEPSSGVAPPVVVAIAVAVVAGAAITIAVVRNRQP